MALWPYGFMALTVWRCLPQIIRFRDLFILNRVPVDHFLSQVEVGKHSS